MDFATLIDTAPVIMTEGSIIERLARVTGLELDPDMLNAGLVRQPAGRRAMAELYGRYLAIGRSRGLPVLLSTPTWRANPDRLAQAGLTEAQGRAIIAEGAAFLDGLAGDRLKRGRDFFLGGLMGCRGDAYRPEESLSADEAARFHRFQAQALAEAGVDFLLAATLPALAEAVGLARAMARTGRPYVVSFVLRPEGALLDGAPLTEALDRLDREVSPPPTAYQANCVYPTVLAAALERQPGAVGRLVGLQANGSKLSPEELDGRAELDSQPPAQFAVDMLDLKTSFGLKILGGCCGADERHIEALAEALVDENARGKATP